MSRLTPVWTEVHTLLLLALLPAFIGTVTAGAAESGGVALLVAGLFAVTVVIGLAFEPFIAIVAGFMSAGLSIGVKQLTGSWDDGTYVEQMTQIIMLIASGAAAGYAGMYVNRLHDQRVIKVDAVTPVFGSTGLLNAELGEMRIDEEIARARRYKRPLSLLRVCVRIRPGVSLTEQQESDAYRAVARLQEGLLRDSDVPYAYAPYDVATVLTESDYDGAWQLVGRIIDASANATFVTRPSMTRRSVHDVANIHFAVATFPQNGASAGDLVSVTNEMLRTYIELDRTAVVARARAVVKDGERPQAAFRPIRLAPHLVHLPNNDTVAGPPGPYDAPSMDGRAT